MVAGDDEALKTASRSTCAYVELAVVARSYTGRSPHELHCTLMGLPAKGVDRITFLAADGDGC